MPGAAAYQTDQEEEPCPEQKVYKATIHSEFLRHPESGGFFRNPLRTRNGILPTLLSEGEFKHNCLDQALKPYPCIKISESSFRKLLDQDDKVEPSSPRVGGALPELGQSPNTTVPSTPMSPSAPGTASSCSSQATPRSVNSRASSARSHYRKLPLSRLPLPDTNVGCEILVNVYIQPGPEHRENGNDRSGYAGHHVHPPHGDPPKGGGRGRPHTQPADPMQEMSFANKINKNRELVLDGVCMDLYGFESAHPSLSVARVRDGPVAKWNKAHPDLQVKQGDQIVGINGIRTLGTTSLANEIVMASGNVTFHLRRPSKAPLPQKRPSLNGNGRRTKNDLK